MYGTFPECIGILREHGTQKQRIHNSKYMVGVRIKLTLHAIRVLGWVYFPPWGVLH